MIAAQNSTLVASTRSGRRLCSSSSAAFSSASATLEPRSAPAPAPYATAPGPRGSSARYTRCPKPISRSPRSSARRTYASRVPRALDLLDHPEHPRRRTAVQQPDIAPTAPDSAAATIRTRGGDDPRREGGRVHAVLGGGRPVGVHGRHMLGIRLATPADHEPLHHRVRLVDLPLRHHRQALPARGLGDVRQGHDGGPRQVLAGLPLVDVEQGTQAPDGGEHGERRLHVHADVTRVDGDRERLGGRQTGVEGAVDQQPPHVPEGDVTDQVLDVDAPVAQGAALLVRFGDLRLRTRRLLRARVRNRTSGGSS